MDRREVAIVTRIKSHSWQSCFSCPNLNVLNSSAVDNKNKMNKKIRRNEQEEEFQFYFKFLETFRFEMNPIGKAVGLGMFRADSTSF